jgi:thymidylate kinase
VSLSLLPTAAPPRSGFPTAAPLVARLGAALASRGVSYCQWKGHGKRERWESGRGDVDLLVDSTSSADFADVVANLGFKLALPPAGREAAGIVHYFGLDDRTGQLIHLHVYQRLVIGLPWRSHYRLPLEKALLESAALRGGTEGGAIFKTAAPELELIVATLRLSLRHMLRDSLRRTSPGWLDAALNELDRLEEQVAPDVVVAALRRHLPEVSASLFSRCRAALQPGCSPWRRVAAGTALARALSPHACRPALFGLGERIWRRVRPMGQRLASGGSVVALLGGDGSGKSTCADALEAWLESSIATTHVHLGRPTRSLATLAVGGLLKLCRHLGASSHTVAHLELLRSACTARDRFALYRRARRFAAGGGIALCERYPLREGWTLAGPSEVQGHALGAQSPFAAKLRAWERRYYERMTAPDVVFLLRLDPDTAVARKPTEPAEYVRERARVTAATDWSKSGARIVDAAQPLPQVVATLKSELWSTL